MLLSLLGVAAAAWVTFRIYEAVPHIEDEYAYTWQAAVIASGKLTLPSPPEPRSFLIPFVVDYQGLRFGKYPIGWPAVLAVGVWLGLRSWVNPLLAGLGVWLTYRLGKRVFSPFVGLLAALLTLTSPFFLMNSGTLLSHPLSLVLSAAFGLGWLEAFSQPQAQGPRLPAAALTLPQARGLWLPAVAAGLALGWLVVTRPLTALAVALPFGLHGLYLLWRGDRSVRFRLAVFGLLVLAVTLLYPLYQSAATGDPWKNTYLLWWPYDKVGFGPGIGATESGHTLQKAFFSARRDLFVGSFDIFGWPGLSYCLALFGLWAGRRNLQTWLTGSLFGMLVLAYLVYWVGGYLFGPRYYYEGLLSLSILSAAGFAWLAGFPLSNTLTPAPPPRGEGKIRRLGFSALLTALVGFNLFFYMPFRLGQMYRLFGIGAQELAPFQMAEAQALAPALVFVDSERWMHYAIYTDLESPDLSSPFIFAWAYGTRQDTRVAAKFPQRKVFYYYPDEPGRFYTAPRPPK